MRFRSTLGSIIQRRSQHHLQQPRYYPRLGSSPFDPAMVGKLKAYAASLPASSRRPAENAIANIQYRLMIRKDRLPAVDAWLAKHGG